MTAWEYKIEVVKLDGLSLDDSEANLGILGNAGWEMVSLVPRPEEHQEFLAVMKRPIEMRSAAR